MSRWLSVRRIIDRLAAIPLLLVAAPLTAIAAVLVFLEDRHKPILTVGRVGRGFATFPMPKIRTMRPRPQRGPALTRPGDVRVTRVGAVLRKLHLDELPQLVPVLTGTMSILGPRPEDPGLVDHDDARWKAVLSMAPGIAGLSQIMIEPFEQEILGSAEDPEAAYLEQVLPRKLWLDQWYVEHATPYLDLLIVWALVERIALGREETAVERLVARRCVGLPGAGMEGAA